MKTLLFAAGIILGIALVFSMAYSRVWDESTPTDSTYANQIDDYMRWTREDVAERLENMFGGFSSDDANEGCYYIDYIQVKTAPTVSADRIATYSLDDGTNCGLFAKNEDGYTKQILKKIGTDLQLNVEAADANNDLWDETKIRLTNNGYLKALNATGTSEISLIKADANNIPVVPDGAQTATNAAPTQTKGIPNKKYIDDQIDATVGAGVINPTIMAGDTVSVTLPNGLIYKWGTCTTDSSGIYTVTFPTAFPNNCLVVTCAGTANLQYTCGYTVYSISASAMTIRYGASTAVGTQWFAIGY